MSKEHIFLVEDEASLAETLALNLRLSGYDVTIATTGSEGLRVFSAHHQSFSMAILDVMIPHFSGLDLCAEMKKIVSDFPVIFLTARATTHDRIHGLQLGADDYITKPYDLQELLLRISNLLKRTVKPSVAAYSFAGNEINFSTYEVTLADGNKIELSRREIGLLKLLTSSANEVVSRDEILSALWEPSENASSRTIDNYILNFRKLFETNPRQPRHFHSVRGVGYKFTP